MNEKHPTGKGTALAASKHHALRQLDNYRKTYIQNWRINANGHHSQGHYDWMAGQVKGYVRSLEIGCGVGHSTLALLRDAHQVVCIEENPHCIAATQALLTEHGYSVAVIERATAHAVDINSYRLDYAQLNHAPAADCLIIEGDALKDPQLEAWLKAQPRFDAVVCWLLGTHNSRGNNVAVDTQLMPTSFEHRIFVQNNVYELADEILREDGILSVIDRSQMPDSTRLKNAILEGHRDQASVTSLAVQSLDHTPYHETRENGAMRLQLTAPVPSAIPDGPILLSLVAVTSRKP